MDDTYSEMQYLAWTERDGRKVAEQQHVLGALDQTLAERQRMRRGEKSLSCRARASSAETTSVIAAI